MQILRSTQVITRKEHNCWGCTVKYPAGTKMEYSVSKDSGVIQGTYWCQGCQSFMNKLNSYDCQDGFSYGEIVEMRQYY